jgi:hypothetical protein
MDLSTLQMKKHLLLLNRLVKEQMKKILIKTPSKLTDEEVKKYFDMLFKKKEDYYIPKQKSTIINIDEEEFKKLITKKKEKKIDKVSLDQQINNNHDNINEFLSKFKKTTYTEFNRSTMAVYIYLTYILNKHKNDCLIIGKNNKIEWNYNLMSKELLLNENEKKYFNDFNECIKKNKKFIAIPFIIREVFQGHQNIILIDLDKKTAERYEPHGVSLSKYEKENEDINNKLKELFNRNGYKYINPNELCPNVKGIINNYSKEMKDKLEKRNVNFLGFQSIENIYGKKEAGFCIAWSFFYLDMRLSFPNLSPNEIYKKVLEEFKYDPARFLDFIRGYANFLNSYYKKIIKTTDKEKIRKLVNEELIKSSK